MDCFVPLVLAIALAAPVQRSFTVPPSTVPSAWTEGQRTRVHALRLRPGQDLRAELERYAREHAFSAGFVATCAGSLTRATLRFANQPEASVRQGSFEIVSLSGTLSKDSMHLHLACADSTGATFGGHLMDGCTIYTTAEIVLVEMPELVFAREPDSTYGDRELWPRRLK